MDRCKSSEELYYKLEQRLPPHNLMAMWGEPGVMAAIYFYTVSWENGKLKGIG